MPHNLQSAIRDNQGRGKVGDFLKERIQEGSKLSFVSAYFTIYAFEQLKDKLQNIDHLNFLFGEPRFVKNLDPDKTDTRSFKIEDEKLSLRYRLQQKSLARECADWIKDKVDIKSIKQANLLHGKMYHVDNSGIEKALVGSSNFTVSGLGYGANPNIELNLEMDSDRDRSDLKNWFHELWENKEMVEDVKAEVLGYLEQLYQENSPQFIYYKTLYHVFEKFLKDQKTGGLLDVKTNFFDAKIWNALFEFQKDGVKGAINKILTHNGCIIADSVGLGKTFEALAIIKYFELLNQNVLVLCPKKLRENWTIYQAHNNTELNPFISDRFCYTVLCHTDLSRDGGKSGDIDLGNINWGNFGLVVIDESHNFRNNTKGKKDEEGNLIRMSRYERLMEHVIKGGIKTKVLMLSATPVNNNLKDLRNQVSFITEDRDHAFSESLNIKSVGETLKNAQTNFTHWSKQQNRDVRNLLEKLDSSFFKLLDELTIARSRKHIQKYYKETIEKIGEFPKRERPKSVHPFIDLENKFMSYDQLNKEIHNYNLSLFNPSAYVKDEFRDKYEGRGVKNFTQANREHYLIGMMKVNFLKRLESSVSSFATSMERTVAKIGELEKKIGRFNAKAEKDGEIEFDDLGVRDKEDEELEDAWEVGGKIKFDLRDLDLDRWLIDLAKDREQLDSLYREAVKVTAERDAKLAELRDIIKDKVNNPTTNKDGKLNRKILVFTAFADTAHYLYDALNKFAVNELRVHIALVSGGTGGNKTTFGNSDYNHILTNFSPVSKNRDKMRSMPQEGEIDILIATDCISEGQNLQDCDCLINYDIHWNPVRIIQRFGRIDRIGSRNKKVHLINFWPTKDLDNYIALKDRVEARMALVDIAATSDDNLLQDEIRDMIEVDLKYRDKQLKRLKDEVLDLEDVTDGVSLSEFTLDDFRIELASYIEANKKQLEDAPLGLYAVVPSPQESQIIRPGVVFCLRQTGDTSGNETVNPLQPCFLIYIRDDGEVRFNFTQAKQVLEMFRMLAGGNEKAFEPLCAIFNEETGNGSDMARYNDLLEKAVFEISRTFKKRSSLKLTSDRGALLIPKSKQVNDVNGFELVTWLVIK
ncbi:MAG: helicase-related protein [Deltaproteobacteria bacterium]|nr:helicase-related protein [Deltaproteobacteria bacterium]